MEKDNVTLFDTPESDFKMPTMLSEDQKKVQDKLISTDISKSVLGDNKVKIVVLPEESNIQTPNYVLDFTNCSEITIFQKEALMNLLSDDGDTALYLYNEKALTRFGYGMSHKLENLMPLTKKYVFGGDIKIYRDLKRDEPANEVISRDITKLRLNL